MSSASNAFSDGNLRYFRLGAILQDEGKSVVCSVLETYFPRKTFMEYLNNGIVKSKLLSLLRRKILKREQYDILYPITGQVDVKTLDISLLYILIRSLHGTLSPNDSVWTKPGPGNISAEADVARITLTRNRIWGHSDGIELTEDELEREAQYLELTITRLVRTLGVPSINASNLSDRIHDKLTAKFDPQPAKLEAAVSTTNSLVEEIESKEVKHVSTSTSSLQKKRKLSKRIKAYIDPFIIKPKIQTTELNEMLPCKCKTNTKYKPSRKVEPYATCRSIVKCHQRYSLASYFHTNSHTDLKQRCLLAGVARLRNGVVIVTDAAHNCVQAFDNKYDLIDEIECPNPRGICAISDDTVIVSLSQRSKLMMYRCDTKLHYVDDVDVVCDGWLYDVKFANGCAYVLCEKGEIHILNLKKSTEDIVRLAVGGKVEFFDISPHGNRLFISDGRGVMCVDEFGVEQWCYRGNRSRLNTTGVVSLKDKLIVAGWEDNTLIELTHGGKWVREVGVDHVQNPMALFQNGREVCVTQYMSDLNEDLCREIVILRDK